MRKEKQDLRYMKTEKAIQKAFHELLQEKTLQKITVKEIAQRAEINKTTFYAHYETLPDLIDSLESEYVEYIVANLDQVQVLFEDSDRFIENLYKNLQDSKINSISKNGTVSQRFIDLLSSSLQEELKAKNINADQYRHIETLLVFIVHGILGVVQTGEENPEKLAHIQQFVKNGLGQIPAELIKLG